MKRTFIETVQDAFQMLWKDIKDVKWAIILLIAYFAFGKSYLHSLCPMVMITGFPCPGCGLTRAGISLLRLDFIQAFQIHPFIYPIVIFLILFFWNRYIKKHRMGTFLTSFLIAIMAFMIIFYIWRMYKCFPGEPPMNFYRYNLLKRILY